MPKLETVRSRGEPIKGPEMFPDLNTTTTWFGGILEIGAITSISVAQFTDKNGFLRLKTQPYIEIHSGSTQMVEKLYATYGGMRKPRYWYKGGRVAAEIVAATYPYTVARQEHALAMQNWLNAENIKEQIAIARDLQGREWQQLANPAAYEVLLTNPAFVAGVLDSRAYIATRPSRYHHILYMNTASKNLALLTALQSKFGGHTRVTDPAGTEVDHGNIVFETKGDSNVWKVLGSEAIEVVRFASKFIQTPLPKDWDYQRSVEIEEENALLAEELARHVRSELQLLQAGKIPQLSTDSVLGDMFTIDHRRVARYLGELLSPDEQTERRKNIRKFAQRSVDAIVARQIAEHIEKEVIAFQQDKNDRISYKEELADAFGVSDRAIKRHVLPYLDPALQQARLGILRSQITRERNNSYWQRQRQDPEL